MSAIIKYPEEIKNAWISMNLIAFRFIKGN